jgi:hypothetical protein
MKKFRFAALLALVFAIILGFASCGDMATLKLINDTNETQDYAVKINDEWEGSGLSESISPSGSRSISMNNGFAYTVYRSKLNTPGWYLWNGSVSPGETVELRFSELY